MLVKCYCNRATNIGAMALCVFQKVILKRNFVRPETYLGARYSDFFETLFVYMCGQENGANQMLLQSAN